LDALRATKDPRGDAQQTTTKRRQWQRR